MFLDPADRQKVGLDIKARSEQRYFQHPDSPMDVGPPSQKRLDVSAALAKLVKENDITFIGESHGVNEEAFFEKAIASSGASFLALELPTSMQPALNKFLATGRTRDPILQKVVDANPEAAHMWAAAKKAGLYVLAVDGEAPLPSKTVTWGQRQAAREKGMVRNLIDLSQQGKVLAWMGSGHVTLNTGTLGRHSTASSVAANHVKTASVGVESQNRIVASTNAGMLDPFRMNEAYLKFFPESPPKESFALPSSELGDLRTKVNVPALSPTLAKWQAYRTAFDLTVFLSPDDSPLSPLGQP